MSINNKPSPRIRRSPEESRSNILSAAESLLVEHGPQSLRLADVAKAAGVANATVLHHFGSIDAVQKALMERMIGDLVDSIMAIEVPADAPAAARAAGLKTLFDAFETRGAARLAAWLELTDETSRLTLVREAVQEVAQKKIANTGVPTEMAEELILLSVTLAVGVGLFGPSLSTLIGKPPERARELTLQMLLAYLQSLSA
ncbi:MAG: TetR/AcrR family transcriptional regulator [Alphaproteobacteria bacterium]|nr:TetR/AcrR family transcriptional regulator [Alphaproteobacteria bacterium]MBU2082693.1 TetR/AcrR family transcriptional regulator [Alphaproteobacteria bacterium]MBU2142210.1 TetR/AcrR family transcriptional regulator [Alphaproteobacteria bacterium]MBU2196747.1 TetR/AcrR family transcriptional regulator [Alphaproteobacteria bacterium]